MAITTSINRTILSSPSILLLLLRGDSCKTSMVLDLTTWAGIARTSAYTLCVFVRSHLPHSRIRYTIRGSCNRANGRLALTKQYIRGTGDSRENKGHKVDYQGTVQGSLAAGGKSGLTAPGMHCLVGCLVWPTPPEIVPKQVLVCRITKPILYFVCQ